MGVTTILAAICSAIVMLAWFVLPGSARAMAEPAPTVDLAGAAQPEAASVPA